MTKALDLTPLRQAAEAAAQGQGPAHDFAHVQRVAANARCIGTAEGADLDVVVPAALLHELFNYPKDHPDSPRSGEICAERAAALLQSLGWPAATIEAIAYCIRVHPFSRGILPETLEGRALQDADRLDAIGAIGVARCFASCAEMGRPFYAPDDPFCTVRPPDDKQWGVDHFYRKLLRIPEGLHTPTARQLAAQRVTFMQTFLAQLGRELAAE
jgi:uncharacterized protein